MLTAKAKKVLTEAHHKKEFEMLAPYLTGQGEFPLK
jgi:hypothetical protein